MAVKRLELTLQFDPKDQEALATVAQELEAGLPPEQWEALLALSRALIRQTEQFLLYAPG